MKIRVFFLVCLMATFAGFANAADDAPSKFAKSGNELPSLVKEAHQLIAISGLFMPEQLPTLSQIVLIENLDKWLEEKGQGHLKPILKEKNGFVLMDMPGTKKPFFPVHLLEKMPFWQDAINLSAYGERKNATVLVADTIVHELVHVWGGDEIPAITVEVMFLTAMQNRGHLTGYNGKQMLATAKKTLAVATKEGWTISHLSASDSE